MKQRLTSTQRGALDRERLRISRDIHDNLGARLTEMILLSDLARRNKSKAEEVEAHMSKMSRIAREVVRDLDAIVWAVNPRNDFLDNLTTYISQYVERFLGITDIRYRLDLAAELPHCPLDSEARHNLFLVVKEALNNIVKHSAASEVRLRMSVEYDVLVVEIDDNGKGFEPSALTRGNGLENMQKRIGHLGGQLALTTQIGQGTHLEIRLPFSRAFGATAAVAPAPVLQAA